MPQRPDDIQRGETITARWLNASKNAPPANIRGGAGILVKRMGGDLVIECTVRPGPIPSPGVTIEPFRIAFSTQDGVNNRWTYTAKRQVKSTTGYGGWEDSTTDTADYGLYNSAEDQNGATGTYGNGISQTNLDSINGDDGTFALQAIPNDTRVWARRVVVADGTVEWWIIGMPNGVDGACA